MKQLILIILGIFLLGSINAIYPGESQLYIPSDVGLDSFASINITNNLSYIGYEFNESWINITIPTDAEPQNFTIIFSGYAHEEEVIVKVPSESSGGSSGACYRGYIIGEWSECINGIHNRTITNDYKTCYQTKQIKPSKNQSCSIIPENNTIIIQEPKKETEFFLWTWLKWLWAKIIFWK